jgi:2,4-dienoyl-CoA reductase-like NADH-dependent reductase (Old Yellow Enzyme family)
MAGRRAIVNARYATPGACRSTAEFRALLHAIDPTFDCVDRLSASEGPLGRPLEFKGRTIGNRFVAHPMEGWDGTSDGSPSEHTIRRWKNFGRSTAKLVWGGEAFAVQEDGRANPRQLYLNPSLDTEAGLTALRSAVLEGHRSAGEETHDLYIGLQLTHSGRYSRPHGDPRPRIACASQVLDPRTGVDPRQDIVTDQELEAIGDKYVRAATLAREAGFDFVDLKCCHGYLLHELLGARGREGPYGGSFENRTRFFRRLVSEIRSACPDLEIAVRVSIADVFPHQADPSTGIGQPGGWQDHLPYDEGFGVLARDPRQIDLQEPLAFLGLLESLDIRLVNVTLGSPYTSYHLQRPARYPASDGYLPPRDPLAAVFEHVRCVRSCKQAFPDLLLVGTGYTYLQEYLAHVAEYEIGQGNVDFVGLGRMLLAYPEFPRDVLLGRALRRDRICRTFSDCTTAPRAGLLSGCYPLDPHYKMLPDGKRLAEIKKTLRNREE